MRCTLRAAIEAGVEPSVVLQRVEDASERNHGYNAATLAYGEMLQMGVIDPAKVTRLALQNAGSIAALVLTTVCMITNAPKQKGCGEPGGVEAALPDF
jgi:chaperonin GroEL